MNDHAADNQPLISIVTLNYNQAAVTEAFLRSCLSLRYPNYEILVCDMASEERLEDKLDSSHYPKTRILHSGKNLGFAGGNNWGIRQAAGEFIFIVNNDTELTPDILDLLILPFSENPAIGVVCPKIRYFSNPDVIQYAGFRPMNPYTGRTSTVGDQEKDLGQYDIPGPTFGAHGCAMMVKREVIARTGMFPEKFFLYYEEWDWSARIQKAGFIIWYQPSAIIYHKVSLTVGREIPRTTYYLTRIRILYMRRNSGVIQLFLFILFYIFFTFPKAVLGYIFRGEWAELRYFLKGVWYNLRHSSSSAQ